MGTTLIPIQANLYLAMLQEDEVPSWNKTGSEFILILTMWVKDKESKIQMVKETSTRASSNQIVPVQPWQWWGENFSINKIVPVHHDFNSNVEENSQELKIKFRFNSSLWSRITTIKWVLLQAVTEFNKNQNLWILKHIWTVSKPTTQWTSCFDNCNPIKFGCSWVVQLHPFFKSFLQFFCVGLHFQFAEEDSCYGKKGFFLQLLSCFFVHAAAQVLFCANRKSRNSWYVLFCLQYFLYWFSFEKPDESFKVGKTKIY